MVNKTRKPHNLVGAILLALSFVGGTNEHALATGADFFTIEPETAKFNLDRHDYKVGSTVVVARSLRRLQKDRGVFGPGWCSNLDLKLTEVDVAQPKVVLLHDCMLIGRTQEPIRKFRLFLEAWVEESSASRILKRADGRWEQTEFPQAIFRPDGQLESFLTADRVRWHLRRDGASQISGLDNLKGKSIQFRRNVAGDLDAIVDATGSVLVRYRLTTMLESTTVGALTEHYEYDADGNLLKLSHSSAKAPFKVWRFAYTTSEWVSKVHWPDGCVSEWLFERPSRGSDSHFESRPVAKESKSCRKETLEAVKPVTMAAVSRKLASAPKKVSPAVTPTATQSSAQPTTQTMLKKVGPLGIGEEKSQVTLNREGLPILFEIIGPDQQVRRLEIEREEFSGSTQKIRSRGVEVSFQKRPREYDSKQLDLLDDYEAWMSAWGSR